MIIIRKANITDLEQIIKLDEECFGIDRFDMKYWKHLLDISEMFIALTNINDNNIIIGVIATIPIISIGKQSKQSDKSYKSEKLSYAIKNFLEKYDNIEDNIKDNYLIVTICVDKSYRSLGIGSKLLKKAIKHKKTYVLLNVRKTNTKAIKFYEKHGFYISEFIDKKYYNNPKDDGLLMYYIR